MNFSCFLCHSVCERPARLDLELSSPGDVRDGHLKLKGSSNMGLRWQRNISRSSQNVIVFPSSWSLSNWNTSRPVCLARWNIAFFSASRCLFHHVFVKEKTSAFHYIARFVDIDFGNVFFLRALCGIYYHESWRHPGGAFPSFVTLPPSASMEQLGRLSFQTSTHEHRTFPRSGASHFKGSMAFFPIRPWLS